MARRLRERSVQAVVTPTRSAWHQAALDELNKPYKPMKLISNTESNGQIHETYLAKWV